VFSVNPSVISSADATPKGYAEAAALRSWLTAEEPIPYELRDVGLLKLFFAGSLAPADAEALLDAVQRRSEARVATLAAIRDAASELRDDGNGYPLLTLELGIAFHQAMADVCARFAEEAVPIR
jgi:hypothetical protein